MPSLKSALGAPVSIHAAMTQTLQVLQQPMRRLPYSALALAAAAYCGFGSESVRAQTASDRQAPFAEQRNAPASANLPAPAAWQAAFIRTDTNQDQALDREEAQQLPAIGKHFDALDIDGDGQLSLPEFERGVREPLP